MAAVNTDSVIPSHLLADAEQVKPPLPPTPGDHVGTGLDDVPRSPAKVSGRPTPRPSKPASVPPRKPADPAGVVYEKVNGTNGSRLTSVKPPDDYDESLELDEREKRDRPGGRLQLVSGRQPSAGWERSG